jgi:hypothetical protein
MLRRGAGSQNGHSGLASLAGFSLQMRNQGPAANNLTVNADVSST